MQAIDQHAALIYTMVLVSAAEGRISDEELRMMGAFVQTLPAFADFDRSRISAIGDECVEILGRDDGLDMALDRISEALPARVRETAYVLACDIVAADRHATQDELRLLEILRQRLDIERLVAAAIERAAAARFRRL